MVLAAERKMGSKIQDLDASSLPFCRHISNNQDCFWIEAAIFWSCNWALPKYGFCRWYGKDFYHTYGHAEWNSDFQKSWNRQKVHIKMVHFRLLRILPYCLPPIRLSLRERRIQRLGKLDNVKLWAPAEILQSHAVDATSTNQVCVHIFENILQNYRFIVKILESGHHVFSTRVSSSCCCLLLVHSLDRKRQE